MWMVYNGQLPPVWGIQKVAAGGGAGEIQWEHAKLGRGE